MVSDSGHKLPITPETKVGELLKFYPELKDVLFRLSPAFEKLKNPVLRRTVGKIATLRQAALMAKISVTTLVRELQQAAGVFHEIAPDSPEESAASEKPSWVVQENISRTFDASAMISKGDQPLGTVMSHLKALHPGELYQLITPFVPMPVIDLARSKGYEHWTTEESDQLVRTYFRRCEHGDKDV